MKNILLPKTALILALITTLACCKEDPPPTDPPCMDGQLPCATQEGKNTFGCYIDGEPFVAKVSNQIGLAAVSATYDINTNYIQILGQHEINQNLIERVYFCFFAENSSGTFPMFAIDEELTGYEIISGGVDYFHDTTNFGQVYVSSINTSVKFVSGTFDMTLKNTSYGSDSLMVISDGRFDIRY